MKLKWNRTPALQQMTAALVIIGALHPLTAQAEAGLAVTFTAADGKTADTARAPQIALFVAEGKPPTPFVPGGKFTAVFEGSVAADLRGEFLFQAELNGALKLEINGAVALEAAGAGGATPLTRPVSLNKGANVLKATFTSPAKGDAFVRVLWTENGFNPSPMPLAQLSHTASPALERGTQLRLGRELFIEHRCANCHMDKFSVAGVPELKMDAPGFADIGARRTYDWLARWILDPKAQRATAHMPKLLRGDDAQKDAEAIAAYLASLKAGGEVKLVEPPAPPKPTGENLEPANSTTEEKKPLFEKLHCVACHNAPGAKEADAKKISLTQVAEKFAPGKLAEFLRQPEAHYAWIRMPNFKLNSAEAKELTDYLLAGAAKPKEAAAPADAAILERGKSLVQSTGCLNCHGGVKLDNKAAAVELAKLDWTKGCAAGKPGDKAPQFDFAPEERAALAAFGRAGADSLTRHAPMEFAARQTHALNCAACHGQFDGFPPLEILGGKLKPEWAGKFIGGEIMSKMRNDRHPKGELWLEARMPAFKARGNLLAEGMSAQHGYGPVTPDEGPVDEALARDGHKLIGKDGGLSCVSCHAVNNLPAAEVFESEGLNFGDTAARLQRSYYLRWMRNPAGIDPQTKMPVFWDDSGKSPLTDVLDGDSEKQLNAIWHYVRLGEKMPKPAVPE